MGQESFREGFKGTMGREPGIPPAGEVIRRQPRKKHRGCVPLLRGVWGACCLLNGGQRVFYRIRGERRLGKMQG